MLLTTAIPTIAFILLVYGLYWYLVRRFDKLHTWLLLLTAGVMAAAVIAAKSGLAMPVCLLILSLAPVVTIIGYEWRGHRYQADALGLLE